LVWPKPSTEGPAQVLLCRGLDPPERLSGFPEIQTGDRFIDVKNQLLMVHGAIQGVPHDLVWNLNQDRLVHLARPKAANPSAVAFASDGSVVILCGGFRLEKLDLATGVSEVWQDATPGMVICAAILPDHRTVFIGGGFGLLGKLDFPTRRIVKEVPGSPMAIKCMCLSPSGTRLATGDRGGHVRLWDVQTLREVALLGTHPGPVEGLSFTPDGRNLLSVDTTELRVWPANR
jgi:WD40 repeat protein